MIIFAPLYLEVYICIVRPDDISSKHYNVFPRTKIAFVAQQDFSPVIVNLSVATVI